MLGNKWRSRDFKNGYVVTAEVSFVFAMSET